MGTYKMDMSEESDRKVLLDEGWREFKIVACEEKTSKAGNLMFVIKLKDVETSQDEDVYAIATQGKRWFLKSILGACGVAAAEDGVYDWSISDIENKIISGRVQHIEEEYTNRESKIVTSKKAKIVEIKEAVPF